jgi:bacillithiol biosynthesis deacetylase BshB1
MTGNLYIQHTTNQRISMKLDVMAIGAHPDDIELTCGGTVTKLVSQGKKVGLIDLTEGELGTRGTREIRAEEAREATRILGVSLRECLGIPDGNIELTIENRLKLIRVIRAYRPDILLFPHWHERHPDHEHAHQLCREAWFYAGLAKIQTQGDEEPQQPFRPRSYYHFMQWYEFTPSFIVDITDEYEQRMEAVRAFKSQFYSPNSKERETALSTPEFMEMLRTRFEYYGDRIGTKYGEPFYSVNMVGISDLYSLKL